MEDILNRTTGVECHESVKISELLYPKEANAVKSSCKFKSSTGVIYHLPHHVGWRTHPLGIGVSNQEILGPVVPRCQYTIWALPTGESDRFNNTIYTVVYMKNTTVEYTPVVAYDIIQACDIELKHNHDALKQAFRVSSLSKVLLGNDERYDAVREFDKRSPYCRMLIGAELFRIFPQQQLMELSFETFNAILGLLVDPMNGAEATANLAKLCFSYTNDIHHAPEMRASEGLHAVVRHFGFPTTVSMPESEWEMVCVCLEFFQRALQKQKHDGHTFGTPDDLVDAYISAGSTSHCGYPSIAAFMAEQRVLTPDFLNEVLRAVAPRALKLKIIYKTREAINPRLPCAGDNTMIVFYAGDDWMTQIALNQTFSVMHANWDVALDADGCTTSDDVLAKIEASARPRSTKRGPGWDNQDFQRIWETLDERQKEGVVKAVLNPVSIMTGPPGCGKTEVFRALNALFSKNIVLPVAAYGRIVNMLRVRLAHAWTFHRAYTIATYGSKNASEQKVILSGSVGLVDEYSLIVADHLVRLFFSARTNQRRRIVLAGDPNQMDAIGSGSMTHSLSIFLESHPEIVTTLNIPHRFLPNCGVGMTAEQVATLLEKRPSSARSPLTVPWNMARMLEHTNARDPFQELDLVYSTTDAKARLFVLENCDSFEAFTRNLSDKLGYSLSDLHRTDIQAVTKLNKDCDKLASDIRQTLMCLQKPPFKNSFQTREKVAFLKNAYFSVNSDDEGKGDVDINYQALRSEQTAHGVKRKRDHDGSMVDLDTTDITTAEKDDAATQARKRQKRTDGWRGTDSDDVFNGDVKILNAIYDVNKKGTTLNYCSDMSERKQPRAHRILGFDDQSQINMDHYDVNHLRSGLLITSKKLQGGERPIIIYFLKDHAYLYADEIYTTMTRGAEQVILVSAMTAARTMVLLQRILAKPAPKKRERFAFHVNFAPTSSS